MSTTPTKARKNLLILGGGFAGVQAAIAAAKTGRFDVTLVSDRDFMYLFPISIWIPTRNVKTEKTRVPLDVIARTHGFNVVVSSVQKIDTDAESVELSDQTLGYDYLVIALGPGKTAPKGSEHTISLCAGPDAAFKLRDRLDELVAQGSGKIAIGFGGNPKDRSAVRGGPAFELLFNIDHMLRRKGLRDKFELEFFAPMENPGARMGSRAAAMMPQQFERLSIGMRSGIPIDGFDETGVSFTDGSHLPADLIMFIPGGSGHPVVKASGLPTNDAGFIAIDDHCLVSGTENVYAIGDSAAIQGPDWRAKQGHLAEVMARMTVANIINHEKGVTERHSYIAHISIVCLMDTGNGAMFVARTGKHQIVLPLPFIGHWMKRGWGVYARATKATRMPRIPGM